MTFLHAEVLDIRTRARQLGKLLSWEEEGAVVERWVENCSMLKESSRLALGRYIKRFWQREHERQRAIKQSKPTFAYKWQPPGPKLLEVNRVRCNEGTICFALDVISQWHKNYRFVVGFLEEMEATVAFSRWRIGARKGSTTPRDLLVSIQRGTDSVTPKPIQPRQLQGARRKAPLHHSDRVLSASKPQAMLLLFAGSTAPCER
jgi:hypothetical protein